MGNIAIVELEVFSGKFLVASLALNLDMLTGEFQMTFEFIDGLKDFLAFVAGSVSRAFVLEVLFEFKDGQSDSILIAVLVLIQLLWLWV